MEDKSKVSVRPLDAIEKCNKVAIMVRGLEQDIYRLPKCIITNSALNLQTVECK